MHEADDTVKETEEVARAESSEKENKKSKATKSHLKYDIYGDYRKTFIKLVKAAINNLSLSKQLDGFLAEVYLNEDNKKGYLDHGNAILAYLEV